MFDFNVGLVRHGDFAYRLVVRSWRTCQWTRAFVVWQDFLNDLGLTLETVQGVTRCGQGMEANCRYFGIDAIEKHVGLDLTHLGSLGLLVEDSKWNLADTSSDMCRGDALRKVTNPSRVKFPGGLDRWIAARLEEKGFAASMEALHGRPADAAVQAIDTVCVDDIQNFWAGWNESHTVDQIVIIGCGAMNDNPTQYLLNKDVGGLFVDKSTERVVEGRRGFARPHRMIINATADPSDKFSALLDKYARFVRRVDVVQVDIDSYDAVVVFELLKRTRPKAIVVEVRHMAPFPFRYACIQCEMGYGYGGANLNYWIHELGLRGFQLEALDRLDAVFVRGPAPVALVERQKLLGTLACYLRNTLVTQAPAELLGRWQMGQFMEPTRENLESLHLSFREVDKDFRFHLDA